MEFNEFWTKKDNDLMRQMIKEKKTTDEIINFFGKEKISHHPKKKFSYGGALPHFDKVVGYNDFLSEIYISAEKTNYETRIKESPRHKPYNDYTMFFKTNSGAEYILSLIYVEDSISPFPNQSMYNISFTIAEQYNLENDEVYEKETNKKEFIELMKRLVYIIKETDKRIRFEVKNPIYIIGETKKPQKIEFYRNIIHDSLPEYKEVKGKSSINLNKDAFYYFK